ncbi:hypothetical protein BD309DRAFT_259006 [Dichomitus squalens]|nr:hypothetical protein BD309DRAFT_259006 [Dichomitus squalens]
MPAKSGSVACDSKHPDPSPAFRTSSAGNRPRPGALPSSLRPQRAPPRPLTLPTFFHIFSALPRRRGAGGMHCEHRLRCHPDPPDTRTRLVPRQSAISDVHDAYSQTTRLCRRSPPGSPHLSPDPIRPEITGLRSHQRRLPPIWGPWGAGTSSSRPYR